MLSVFSQIPVVGVFAWVVFKMMAENRLYLESRDKHIGETHKLMADAITELTRIMHTVDKNMIGLIAQLRGNGIGIEATKRAVEKLLANRDK